MIIKLPEHLNERTIGEVKQKLATCLAFKYPSIALDFSEVRDMDSSALETLLECTDQVARHDGAIRISGMSPEAATLLEITRMDRVFEMFPTVPAVAPTPTVNTPEFATVSSVAQDALQVSAA
jgi:anti-sigma B factor antagonist